MSINTKSDPFRKFRSVDITSGGWPSRVPQRAKPTGIDLAPGGTGATAPSLAVFTSYGACANNGTWSLRAYGWRRIGSNETTRLWVPVILCELACVAGLSTGILGAEVSIAVSFADTLTLVTGNDDVSIDLVSPANDTIAHASLDVKGFEVLEFTFKSDFGTVEMNALVSTY